MEEKLNIKDIIKSIEEMRKSQAQSQADFDARFEKHRESQAKTDVQIKELREAQAKTDVQIKELRAAQAKTDVQIKELRAAQAKTDEQLAKTDAQLAKTDAQLAKTDEQLAKTDAQLAKTDAQLVETSRKLESVGDQLSSIGINTGQSAEEFFYRSVSKTLKLGGMQFDKIERNVQLSDNLPEYDIVLYNGKHIMILEVKYKAHPDQLGKLAERKTKSFRKLYPQYKNHELHFGIASKITNVDLIESAKLEKIFLITQQGDHVAVANGQMRSW